jgi:two-component system, NarL family, invasion response regulator UvrY
VAAVVRASPKDTSARVIAAGERRCHVESSMTRIESGSVGVLTVDDQAIFRVVAREVVDATPGFEVLGEASSGEQALVVADELDPDLVLLDVRLPGMDGIETASRLGASHPETVIVLASTVEVKPFPRECGAATFIRKQDLCPKVLAGLWATHRRG